MRVIEIQRTRIDVESIVNTVRRDDAGAIVVFLGTVRSDPDVRALDYEVYRPMALRTLAELVERAGEHSGGTHGSTSQHDRRVRGGGYTVAATSTAGTRRV